MPQTDSEFCLVPRAALAKLRDELLALDALAPPSATGAEATASAERGQLALNTVSALLGPEYAVPQINIVKDPMRRHLRVSLGEAHVISASYNEHGWSGMDAIKKTVTVLACAFGAKVVTSEGQPGDD